MHLELKTKHYQQPNRMAQWNIDQRLKKVHIAFHLCLLSGLIFMAYLVLVNPLCGLTWTRKAGVEKTYKSG